MSDLHIRREHQLGLPLARLVARRWADAAKDKLGMQCVFTINGEINDTAEFSRPGVTGRMVVTADSIEMEATLGFMFKAFAGKIQSEADKMIDAALAKEWNKELARREAAARDAASNAG